MLCLARVLALLSIGACFPTRSENYACHDTSDCTSGRTCDRGYCVLGADGGANTDAFDCASFTSSFFTGCSIPAPGPALDLTMPGTYTYNTDFATFMDPAGATIHPPDQIASGARLISVDSLTIASGTTLRVVGAKPFLIASWTSITVNGVIDASSNMTAGAGANPATCSGHAAVAGRDDAGGGGGGGGGGLGGTGGKGGNGNGQATGGGAGGTTGPIALAGGCPGGRGGIGIDAGGVPGDGGGAVQLTARQTLAVGGKIHVGGGGGGGAPITVVNNGNGGGGGGGTGGCIGLESPMVTIAAGATLAANGGGGGGAANRTNAGSRGGDATASATAAPGGTAPDGGKGGVGSSGATLTGANGGNDGTFGAGGGGGAAGYIVISSVNAT